MRILLFEISYLVFHLVALRLVFVFTPRDAFDVTRNYDAKTPQANLFNRYVVVRYAG